MNALKTWLVILTLTCGIIVTMAFESGLLRVLAAPIQQGDPEDPMPARPRRGHRVMRPAGAS